MEAQLLEARDAALAEKQKRRDGLALQVAEATRDANAQLCELTAGAGDVGKAADVRGQAQALGLALTQIDSELAADRAKIEAARQAQQRAANLKAGVDAAHAAAEAGRAHLVALADVDAAIQVRVARLKASRAICAGRTCPRQRRFSAHLPRCRRRLRKYLCLQPKGQ